MRFILWVVTPVLISLTAVSCGSGQQAVNCQDLVNTPGGPAPRACVHEIPDNATVTFDGGTAIVTVDGGVVATYAPCPCDAGAPGP